MHVRVSRNPDNKIAELHLSITQESLANFQQLVQRALNCWDSAPKELKELGDMLTHGYITQDYTYVPINSVNSSGDMYSQKEQDTIKQYIATFGFDAWFRRLRENTVHEVLNHTAKD